MVASLCFSFCLGSAFESSYRVASPLVLFVRFCYFLLGGKHFSVYSTVETMVSFLFWGPGKRAFVAWLPSAGAYSLVSFQLFFYFLLGLAFLFCPQHARGGKFFFCPGVRVSCSIRYRVYEVSVCIAVECLFLFLSLGLHFIGLRGEGFAFDQMLMAVLLARQESYLSLLCDCSICSYNRNLIPHPPT